MLASALEIAATSPDPFIEQHVGESVRRSAFYIQGQGEPVFAWLHRHASENNVDHGVIICPPIGYEQLHAHRSLRHLADGLARDAVPALRFDWHGTGDSPGHDEDPQRFLAWLKNIRDAVQWMRQELGCRQISLIGLRIGATLAMLATENNEIDNLVLWSPVIKGRAYVREMTALSLTSDAPIRQSSFASNDIEAGGFTLSSETATDLSPIDLMKCRPRCQRVLLVTRADLPEDDRLANQWTAYGLQVDEIRSPGFSEMMLEPHRSQIPHSGLRQIKDWIGLAIGRGSPTIRTDDHACRRTAVAMPSPAMTSNPMEVRGRIRESAFPISTQPDLFGIVSEPVNSNDREVPTIVLLNSGSAYRIGASRLNVLIARHLAAQGFRCVRMDLSGLGDSSAAVADEENDAYSPLMFRDIDLTLKQVEKSFAAKQIVLLGLCSGAYAAFQSATRISNPALVESILINPLTYFWTEGMTLEAAPTKDLMSFKQDRGVAVDPQNWVKLLSGQSKIGIRGALAVLARRFGLFRSRPVAKPARKSRKAKGKQISHPKTDDLPGDLKQICRAKRNLAMIFSTSDPGFNILNVKARRKANELRAKGRLKVQFIDEADHTFTQRAARADLIQAVANHLRTRYQ